MLSSLIYFAVLVCFTSGLNLILKLRRAEAGIKDFLILVPIAALGYFANILLDWKASVLHASICI